MRADFLPDGPAAGLPYRSRPATGWPLLFFFFFSHARFPSPSPPSSSVPSHTPHAPLTTTTTTTTQTMYNHPLITWTSSYARVEGAWM